MNEAAWQQVVKAIENIDKKEKTSSETNRGKGRSPVTVSRFDRSTRGRQRFHPIITIVVAECVCRKQTHDERRAPNRIGATSGAKGGKGEISWLLGNHAGVETKVGETQTD
jgi:hypothetical protein